MRPTAALGGRRRAAAALAVTILLTSCPGVLPPAGVQAPAELAASDGSEPAAIHVSWSHPLEGSGEVGYQVLRSITPDGTYELVGTSDAASYDDADTIGGVIYHYRVRAVRGDSRSPLSASDSGYRGLRSPSWISASDGESAEGVIVSWEEIGGAEEYRLYRGPRDGSLQELAASASASLEDTGAEQGVTYTYRVRAYAAAAGWSPWSPADDGWIAANAGPTDLSASDASSYDAVLIAWSSVESAELYHVFRADLESGPFDEIGTATETSYSDGTAVPGVQYYYRVRAYSAAFAVPGYSVFSNTDGGSRRIIAAPGRLVASDGSTTDYVELQWEDVADATSFALYRSLFPGEGYELLATATETAARDETCWPGQTYYYYVRSYRDGHGYSEKSSLDSGYRELEQYAPDDTGVPASLSQPFGLALDPTARYLYISHRASVFVGKWDLQTGAWGVQDWFGPSVWAYGLATDSAARVYLAEDDGASHFVRKITAAGRTTAG